MKNNIEEINSDKESKEVQCKHLTGNLPNINLFYNSLNLNSMSLTAFAYWIENFYFFLKIDTKWKMYNGNWNCSQW